MVCRVFAGWLPIRTSFSFGNRPAAYQSPRAVVAQVTQWEWYDPLLGCVISYLTTGNMGVQIYFN